MNIQQAEFISSVTDLKSLPKDGRPEFAFIGRSNVGKSSLLNMLTGRRQLAKTSVKPGKTQTINHFLINNQWYLVDLPGYGYASVSKDTLRGLGKIIDNYVTKSENLCCLFVLVDIRHEPQANDLRFIQWAGSRNIPLAIVFTKSDKLDLSKGLASRRRFEATLLKSWTDLPPLFVTSTETKKGKDELLLFIEQALTREKQNR